MYSKCSRYSQWEPLKTFLCTCDMSTTFIWKFPYFCHEKTHLVPILPHSVIICFFLGTLVPFSGGIVFTNQDLGTWLLIAPEVFSFWPFLVYTARKYVCIYTQLHKYIYTQKHIEILFLCGSYCTFSSNPSLQCSFLLSPSVIVSPMHSEKTRSKQHQR